MIFKERLFLSVAGYAWWQRYIITMSVVVILCGTWWFFGYQHLYNRLRKVNEPSAPREQNPAMAEVPKEFQQLFHKQVNSFFVASDLNNIAHTILLHGIAKHSLELETYLLSDIVPREWYSSLDLKLMARGKFFDIIGFCEQLDSYANMICQRCEMFPLDNGTIRCSWSFTVYLPK